MQFSTSQFVDNLLSLLVVQQQQKQRGHSKTTHQAEESSHTLLRLSLAGQRHRYSGYAEFVRDIADHLFDKWGRTINEEGEPENINDVRTAVLTCLEFLVFDNESNELSDIIHEELAAQLMNNIVWPLLHGSVQERGNSTEAMGNGSDSGLVIRLCQLISRRIIDDVDSPLTTVLQECERFFTSTFSAEGNDSTTNSSSSSSSNNTFASCFAMINMLAHILEYDQDKQRLSAALKNDLFHAVLDGFRESVMDAGTERWLARCSDESSTFELRRLTIQLLLPKFLHDSEAIITVKMRLHNIWILVDEIYNRFKLGVDARRNNNGTGSSAERLQAYSLMCLFYDKFFHAELTSGENGEWLDIRTEETFWQMILHGLNDEESSLIAKRSLFLLKRAIDTSNDLGAKGNSGKRWTRYFQFDHTLAKQWNKAWELFILIHESLDQHSSHLIRPIWHDLYDLFPLKKGLNLEVKTLQGEQQNGHYDLKKNKKQKRRASQQQKSQHKTSLESAELQKCFLDFCWVEKLFLKALQHSNFGVHRMALMSLFQFDFNLYDSQFLDKNFLHGSLVDHMNETKLYFNKHTRVGPFAQTFFHNYLHETGSDDEKREFLGCLLRKIKSDSRMTKIALTNWLKILVTFNTDITTPLNMLSEDDLHTIQGILDFNINVHQPWITFRMQSLILETIVRLSHPTNVSLGSVLQVLQMMDFENVVCHPALLAALREWITKHPELDAYLINTLSTLINNVFDSSIHSEEVMTNSSRSALLLMIALPLLGDSLITTSQALELLINNCSRIYVHTHLDEAIPIKTLFMIREIIVKCCNPSSAINDIAVANRNSLVSAIVLDNLDNILSYTESIVKFPDDITAYTHQPEHKDFALFDIAVNTIELLCEINNLVHDDRIICFLRNATDRCLAFIKSLTQQHDALTNLQDISLHYNRFLLLALEVTGLVVKQHESFMQDIGSSHARVLDVLTTVFDFQICATSAEQQHQQSRHIGRNLTSNQVVRHVYKAKFEIINIVLLYFVRHCDGMQHFAQEEEHQGLYKKLLSSSLEMLDMMHLEDAYLCFDVVRLLIPLIADDEIEHAVSSLMGCVMQIGRKFELHCYESLCSAISSLFVSRPLSEDIVQSCFRKQFFSRVTAVSSQAQRPLIPLAFHLSSAVLDYINSKERHNDVFVLSLAKELMELLLFAQEKEVSEDDELEQIEIISQDTAYVIGTRHSTTVYPSIYKVPRIVNAIIFSLFDRLNGMEDETGFCEEFIRNFFVTAIDKIVSIESRGGTNSMPGSPGHKQKMRLWKMLNWIIPSIDIAADSKETRDIKSKLWKLLRIPNMSSVRRLMELFFVAMALKFDWMVEFLADCMGNFNERAQVLSSLAIIAGNVIRFCSDEKLVSYFRSLFPFIEQITHTHQYMLRVSCQLMFTKIYQELLNPKDERIGTAPSPTVLRRSELLKRQIGINEAMIQQWRNTYIFIHDCESTLKFIQKYEAGFVLDPFSISKPPSLISTPLLQDNSSMDDPEKIDDYVPMHLFDILQSPDDQGNKVNTLIMSLCFTSDRNSGWIVRDLTRTWRLHNPYSATVDKSRRVEYPVESPLQQLEALYVGLDEIDLVNRTKNFNIGDIDDAEDDNQIYQRKIETWKQMTFETELSTVQEQKFVNHQQSIIVVASLIDNWTNIAGLSRTSEIFRAESVCVHNLDIVKRNPDFRSISVGAEKWVPIEEVPIEDVRAFCMEKKAQGYTIMGLEQTSSSVPLQNVTFPEKVVLILGREKTGIPTEMLEFVDVAVEIPQLGVLRSLNVHVSASIMLFEYTRQQLLLQQGKQ